MIKEQHGLLLRYYFSRLLLSFVNVSSPNIIELEAERMLDIMNIAITLLSITLGKIVVEDALIRPVGK